MADNEKKDKGKIIIVKDPNGSNGMGEGDIEKAAIEPLIDHYKGKMVIPDPKKPKGAIKRGQEKIKVIEKDPKTGKETESERDTGRQISEVDFEGNLPEGVDEIIIKKEKEEK